MNYLRRCRIGMEIHMKHWLTKKANIGGCMDAVVSGSFLYVISNSTQYTEGRGGCLRVLTLENPETPHEIAIVTGLGNTRQLIMRGDYAYISAREDGIWIINIAYPLHPYIAAHYDSIELATGLAIDGNWLYAACRNYGVEVINIKNPDMPYHTATLRTGEAQSLAVQNGIIYAGVWGTMEVVIIDSHDLNNPKQVYRIPLDGRGDGVFVKGNLLYAATGHHLRSFAGTVSSPEDPTYGAGSGLEIYDISDLHHPIRLSRISMTERIYYPIYDMWSVIVNNGYAYLTLSYHGAVVVDVHDPSKPRIVAQWQAWVDCSENCYFNMLAPERLENFKPLIPFDASKGIISPATNLAIGNGYVYIATGYSDLYTVSFASAREQVIESSVFCSPAPEFKPYPPNVYRPNGQVHGVVVKDSHVYAACGTGGLHELKLESNGNLTLLRIHATEGIAFDVKRKGDFLLVAEGHMGISILRTETFETIAHYSDPQGRVIQQIVISPDERFAIIHTGYGLFQFLDIQDIYHPKCILSDGNEALGGIYGRQICQGAIDYKYMSAHWNSRFIQWYDVSGNTPQILPWRQPSIGFRGGIVVYHNKALVIRNGGYFLYEPSTTSNFESVELRTVNGESLNGKPIVYNDFLFLSDRIGGGMQVVSIKNIENPKLIYSNISQGNPDLVEICNDFVFWPLGYSGLMVYPLKQFASSYS